MQIQFDNERERVLMVTAIRTLREVLLSPELFRVTDDDGLSEWQKDLAIIGELEKSIRGAKVEPLHDWTCSNCGSLWPGSQQACPCTVGP